nr:heavy metal-associated isoprenylated plant protein 41-like [Ipomoea batatas]
MVFGCDAGEINSLSKDKVKSQLVLIGKGIDSYALIECLNKKFKGADYDTIVEVKPPEQKDERNKIIFSPKKIFTISVAQDSCWTKAKQIVASFPGVMSFASDANKKQLVVTGVEINSFALMRCLKTGKVRCADYVSIEKMSLQLLPPEKKDDKKEEKKKDEKKEEEKEKKDNKKEEKKKDENKEEEKEKKDNKKEEKKKDEKKEEEKEKKDNKKEEKKKDEKKEEEKENKDDKEMRKKKDERKILLVGDGDFSFSLCLANSFGSASNILASSLDSYDEVTKKYKDAKSNLEKLQHLGATILHGVDAIKMKLHTDLRMRKFDRIIFNFPHAGFHGKEDNVRLIQYVLICNDFIITGIGF